MGKPRRSFTREFKIEAVEGGVALQKAIEFGLELTKCFDIHACSPSEAPVGYPELALYQILLWRRRSSVEAM